MFQRALFFQDRLILQFLEPSSINKYIERLFRESFEFHKLAQLFGSYFTHNHELNRNNL